MPKIILLFLVIFFSSCSNTKEISPKCYEKPEIGFCKGYFEKYYFDKNEKICKVFYWGGCGGLVPFDDINSCEKTCEK